MSALQQPNLSNAAVDTVPDGQNRECTTARGTRALKRATRRTIRGNRHPNSMEGSCSAIRCYFGGQFGLHWEVLTQLGEYLN